MLADGGSPAPTAAVSRRERLALLRREEPLRSPQIDDHTLCVENEWGQMNVAGDACDADGMECHPTW